MERSTDTVSATTQTNTNPLSPSSGRARNAGQFRGARNASRLFMGNMPKVKTEKDIREEVGRFTSGLVRVITYKNFEDPTLHRGFCFLDYESPEAAAEAKIRLSRYTIFGCKSSVDWADPEPEVDEELMSTVRILFVRQYSGLLDESALAGVFGRYGAVERVKNLKNYAFVHFARRQDAQAAMNALNGTVTDSGVQLEVTWAKPPTDKHTREKVLRDRERRMQRTSVVGKFPLAVQAGYGSTAVNGATSPYSKYDQYQYDFGLQMPCCVRQREDVSLRRCQTYCPCVAAVKAAATGVVASNALAAKNDSRDHQHGDNNANRPWDLRTVRHDHGDYAHATENSSSVDVNILKFFYKITTGRIRHE